MQSERLALPRKKSIERFEGTQSQSKMALSMGKFATLDSGMRGMARSSTMLAAVDPA